MRVLLVTPNNAPPTTSTGPSPSSAFSTVRSASVGAPAEPATVGAVAVVREFVPDGAVVGGVPAEALTQG